MVKNKIAKNRDYLAKVGEKDIYRVIKTSQVPGAMKRKRDEALYLCKNLTDNSKIWICGSQLMKEYEILDAETKKMYKILFR